MPVIRAFRETVHRREHSIDVPQLPTTTTLRALAPIPMISTAIRVEDGKLRVNLRVDQRLFGMDQEEAASYQEDEDS